MGGLRPGVFGGGGDYQRVPTYNALTFHNDVSLLMGV